MKRTVSARLEAAVAEPSHLVLSVAVSQGSYDLSESLTVTVDGRPVEVVEVVLPHGSRFHRVNAGTGDLVVDYRATVIGRDAPAPVAEDDAITYLRPSRFAQSDQLREVANDLFPLSGFGTEQLQQVADWVWQHVSYVPGSSGPTDGGLETYLQRAGVCRDFAHLVIALLRAKEIPARLVSAYAPGLDPMDFHAVVEAAVEDTWYVVDATRLAPRDSLLRIATGSDATDTAFLSTYRGAVELTSMQVIATVDVLPYEDNRHLAELR